MEWKIFATLKNDIVNTIKPIEYNKTALYDQSVLNSDFFGGCAIGLVLKMNLSDSKMAPKKKVWKGYFSYDRKFGLK